MASSLTSSSRGYRPLSKPSCVSRAPQPLPGPLAKIAEAARQNQILALQALQAAAAASVSSSSSSSSPPGSPPFGAVLLASSSLTATSSKRGRKFQAIRAPSSCAGGAAGSSAGGRSSAKLVPLITTTVPYWAPDGAHPLIDPTSGRRSEIYSLTNDRYPGAPGTALAKAREAQQKAIQNAKKEAAKKLASKAELEHLGVKGLAKKRKSSSPYASINHASSSANASAAEKRGGCSAMSRESSTASRGRSTRTANIASSSAAEASGAPASGSSRSRRSVSRSHSPLPLTSPASSSRRNGARGASNAPADEDNQHPNRPASHIGTRSSPSRGTSPPDGTPKTPHNALSSTAPFQSSPLAAGSLTMESSQDADASDADDKTGKKGRTNASELSPLMARSASLKRKASTLSQEILADDEVPENAPQPANDATHDDPSKRAKVEKGADKAAAEKSERSKRRASPASASSSRRTSPRTKNSTLVPLADGALNKYGALTEPPSDATKSRLSALSLEHEGATAAVGPQSSSARRGARTRRGGSKSDAEMDDVRDEDLQPAASQQLR